MEHRSLTADEIAAIDGLDDWRVVLDTMHAVFAARSFPDGAGLVAAIAEAAERLDHHPDLDLRYPGRVRVVLTTHAAGGLTTRDVELAREISRIAAAAGAPAATTAAGAGANAVELAIDTLDAGAIRPFWAAVLDYRERDGTLVDPRAVGPRVWFQQMDEPRTERNRLHVDVTVPHDVAEQRLAAALAAGGRLVTDHHARAWWVLADADGNEACVCTWQDR